MANAQTTQRKIDALENRRKAVALRRMGMSIQDIADKLGLSKSSVHKTITKAMAESRAAMECDVAELKALEVDRCDQLQLAAWPQALKGSTQHIEKVLKIMERRARLLGLDAPTKVAPTTKDGDDLEPTTTGLFIVPAEAASVDAWLAQVQASRKPPPSA